MKTKLTLLAVAAALLSTPVMAQAPSPAKPSPKATAPAVKPAVPAKPASVAVKGQAPRTAKSIDCSKQADAKNVHGKARKSFMSHCKKA
ncbi:PsiF family protein [Novosphingobium terrae]|uniref:PsiF family protein n=1 Tax=Novosphingobium terrae TaxID=2726189 RepID=UPI00197FF02A|nr:PsiF family protein [Novosphingobium terrae]